MLLSEDEVRFPMVPTLCRTLGVKGHRPVVGTWDCKHLLYVFASVNVTSCALHTDTVESRTGLYRATGESKTQRLQSQKGRTGVVEARREKRGKVLRAIAEAYPHLEAECLARGNREGLDRFSGAAATAGEQVRILST